MKLIIEIEEKRYLYYKELSERSQINGEVVSTIEHIIGAGVPLQDKEAQNE